MKDTNRKRGWIMVILLGFCWLLIFSLARDLGRVKNGFKRIDEANLKLAREIERNSELKKKMTYAQSEYYKEKIVREKLNMQRPGEVVVVLPSEMGGPENEEGSEVSVSTKSNWEMWWEVVKD